jgi:phosphohistidine phosphatase
MDLYLLRHAIAVERGTAGYAHDGDRPLTAEGERKMREAAAGMRKLDLVFDRVISSPYLRARRTAEIVVEVFGGTVEFSDALTPDGDPSALLRRLHALSAKETAILLVGHEPYMSRLLSMVLTGTGALQLTLKKGGLCKVVSAEPAFGRSATLEWLLTPRQLRQLS